MAEALAAGLRVQSLSRAVLDGVDDGADGTVTVDLAVLPYFEDERPLQGLAGLVDWRLSGRLSTLLRDGFGTGRAGEAMLLPGRRTLGMERLVLLGLGPVAAFDRGTAESAGRRLVGLVEGLDPRRVLVAMPGHAPDRAVVEALFDGLLGALTLVAPTDDAEPAAKAVDDAAISSDDDDPEAVASPGPKLAPQLGVAAPPASATPLRTPGSVRVPATGSGRGTVPRRWWVVADPRHEARLRRLLDGPPRAAEAGA
ncbi:MAG: hypothetical protein K0V04_44695 [Deltaproteobacteria bacterium]|nr:hypothetical protein [Deltaproteobacteria bacterium]